MKIKSHKQLVEEASLEIENLTPEEAKVRLDDNTIFIDIRDIRELWRDGTIENSKHIPRCMLEFWLDPSSHYYKEEFAVEKKKILFLGVGLHNGKAVSMSIEPSEPNTGIVFERTDLYENNFIKIIMNVYIIEIM